MSATASNKEVIEGLRRSRLFRRYEKVFGDATGLPLALRPLEYWQLAHHGKTNENRFCALLAERPATIAVCLQAHEHMIRHTHEVPHSVTCPYGLTESAVPVRLGESTIGFLLVGQVLRKSQNDADLAKVTQLLKNLGVDFTDKFRSAWERNPLIPPQRYEGIVSLLTFFAEQLSALSNEIAVQRQNSEPPLVLRAREFIDKHKREELSLQSVATAAGASIFHFCKVFRKATGLRFTDYVARVRAEDARTELLNPNRRISEVAYDVGFQSVTQFNRTFKRIFGHSPSDFRAHLHTPVPIERIVLRQPPRKKRADVRLLRGAAAAKAS
ncbi:MAG: helix-turn-helix domain-containing protein [Verrucomicrobiota bacterium]|nr:helix-turn-helix domain-containing protein [Verrucomicrobiota bacterium]